MDEKNIQTFQRFHFSLNSSSRLQSMLCQNQRASAPHPRMNSQNVPTICKYSREMFFLVASPGCFTVIYVRFVYKRYIRLQSGPMGVTHQYAGVEVPLLRIVLPFSGTAVHDIMKNAGNFTSHI